uniref:L-ascorbate peroxidase n=1 Tax=Micromonas pusilla TaxID=38833 RepID=A0A7R9Y7Z5_MICPS
MEDVVNQTPYRAALRACRDDLWKFIDETNANPIFVRLAWHDAGTFDYHVRSWPKCGGANGSIRFEEEMSHGANAGLSKALKYLEPFKAKHPLLSYADVIQLAGATAIEHAGGPKIKMRYGRVDVETPEECAREGNLPGAEPPFGDGSPDAATHLRNVFGRMGFSDREIVALSGAHTIGRAFKERSGVTENGYGAKNGTKFTGCPAGHGGGGGTCPFSARHDGDADKGVGMEGGRSWTKHWLKFDNSYFKREHDEDPANLLWMSTDKALHVDDEFRKVFEEYAESQEAFFADFAAAYKKTERVRRAVEARGRDRVRVVTWDMTP